MAIHLYNSLRRTTEELIPRSEGHIDMFVCGPTVYDRIHIGNARTLTVFDVIAKWLRHRGLDVNYIQNITDIDDRIIARASEKGVDALEFARQFDDAFRADM
jgi:cysteinyl-tRNA synthetase